MSECICVSTDMSPYCSVHDEPANVRTRARLLKAGLHDTTASLQRGDADVI